MSKQKYYELGPFTVFDLETTGFSPVNDRIVEIAALRIEIDGSMSYFQTLVNPNRKIPSRSTFVHKISDDMVINSPHFREIGIDFLEFSKNSTLVAYNAIFDLGFLQESLNRNGLKLWEGKTLDLLALVKKSHTNLKSYKLQFLRDLFNLKDDEKHCQAHRAMSDVIWTTQLLEISLERLIEQTMD